jgi:phenylalanyl-tRNA synthetase alpha chain
VSSPVSYLDPVQLRRDLGLRDLSDPADGRHAIQILIGQAVAGLCGAWGCEVRWSRGPRIVPVADNYDRLGYPAEAITREARYTRYVDAANMLRSHSSAMIPPRRCAGSPASPATTCCWPARESCTAGTPSTGSTPAPRTSSTCGGSPSGQ